jgi:hypothetical protein
MGNAFSQLVISSSNNKQIDVDKSQPQMTLMELNIVEPNVDQEVKDAVTAISKLVNNDKYKFTSFNVNHRSGLVTSFISVESRIENDSWVKIWEKWEPTTSSVTMQVFKSTTDSSVIVSDLDYNGKFSNSNHFVLPGIEEIKRFKINSDFLSSLKKLFK